MKKRLITIFLIILVCGLFPAMNAAPRKAKPEFTLARQGEFNVASSLLGATVTYERVKNSSLNGRIPVAGLIAPVGAFVWGPIMNPPMEGTFHIRFARPLDIQGIAFWQHDRDLRKIRTFDILADGKVVKKDITVKEEDAAKPVRYDLNGIRAQTISIRVGEKYPQKEGKANWGGIWRAQVYSLTNLAEMMKAPKGYAVTANDSTVETKHVWSAPKTYTRVVKTQGNPCLQWDKTDLDKMRADLRRNPVMRKQLEMTKSLLAGYLKNGVKVPDAEKNASGKYVHVSDQKRMPGGTWGRIHNNLALGCQGAALVWQLTGDRAYLKIAKDILNGYVKVYPNYQIGARPGFTHDPSKVFDQRLSDATWLLMLVRGYDLIAEELTEAERKIIEDMVLKDNARHIGANRAHLINPVNWAVISTASILLTGYATHDKTLIDLAENGWNDLRNKKRVGGYPMMFRDGIGEDMLWNEGAMGYTQMALQGLIAMAETLRHHGIDMYAANNGSLKKLFDSMLLFGYPNMTYPAIHDSGNVSIFNWNDSFWEYAWENYRDQRYLPIVRGITRHMPPRFQIFVSTTKYSLDGLPADGTVPKEISCMNFDSVGYGVLRLNGGNPYLLLDYGPHGSHSHPDKLNVDLFVNGEQLICDPGVAWYETKEYKRWFKLSFCHNLLLVDETEQIPARGVLLTFGGNDELAIQRASADKPAPGVIQDRALFLTKEYMLDLFGAFSRMNHTYDLLWHVRGDSTVLPAGFQPYSGKFKKPGYCELQSLRRAETNAETVFSFVSRGQNISKLVDNKLHPVLCGKPGSVSRLIMPAGQTTEFITGFTGLVNAGFEGSAQKPPRTIIERRTGKNAFFCNVVDFSNRNAVRKIRHEGGLEKGFAAAEIHLADGFIDRAIVNYSRKKVSFAGMETDALQAYARVDGTGKVRACVFAGGTHVRIGSFELKQGAGEKGVATYPSKKE